MPIKQYGPPEVFKEGKKAAEMGKGGADRRPPYVGWVWQQPARPSALRKRHGLRASSQSGGLAEGALECGRAFDAKHT